MCRWVCTYSHAKMSMSMGHRLQPHCWLLKLIISINVPCGVLTWVKGRPTLTHSHCHHYLRSFLYFIFGRSFSSELWLSFSHALDYLAHLQNAIFKYKLNAMRAMLVTQAREVNAQFVFKLQLAFKV